MSSDVPAFKVPHFASDFEFEIEVIDNSYFAHHIVIYRSLFKVSIEKLHNNSHKRETIYHKSILFAKFLRQWKSKEWAKLELECPLLIFIYSNSNLKSLVKTWTLNAGISELKEKPSHISDNTSATLSFYQWKYSNFMVILSTLESYFSPKDIKYTVRQSQVCY